MVIHFRLAVALALAILSACGTTAPPSSINTALAARVPPATVVLAGINLDQLRTSPLYPRLPPSAQAFLTPFANSHEALVASTGTAMIAIARGVVPGATQVAPGIALYGAPDLIAAAIAKHAPAGILGPAESVASGHTIWIAIQGGIALPLEGNLANLNNLLRGADYVTLAVQPTDPIEIDITAQCPTPAAAIHFEQSVRALASLTAAANARDPQLSAMLQAVRITQTDRVVRVAISAPLDALSRLASR